MIQLEEKHFHIPLRGKHMSAIVKGKRPHGSC